MIRFESCEGSEAGQHPASFRDPSGFIFLRDGRLLRQVNRAYRDDYDRLMGSGLYDSLVADGLLIAHGEVDEPPADPERAYRILEPERVGFVSYPYEWCPGALREAALLTLAIQKRALSFGMSLKDASAYNVQFQGGSPVFIDTLSFESYRDGRPWDAYRQFCRHFLAPLALMSRRDARLGQFLKSNPEGVPLDLASSLLPRRSCLNLGLLLHLHLHARMETSYGGRQDPASGPRARRGVFNKRAMLGLVESLESVVRGLHRRPGRSEWSHYGEERHYSATALANKRETVGRFLRQVRPEVVWDLGANTGEFSRMAASEGARTIAFDADFDCVERIHQQSRERGREGVLALVTDLTNPSPALGWRHHERASLLDRGPADMVLALALVHHLAISGNLPLPEIAAFCAEAGRRLVMEWVPKTDPQAKRLLVVRDDIFADYHRAGFERAFADHFEIEEVVDVAETERTLYLMRRRGEH